MSPPLASIISALSLGPLVLSLSAAAAPVQLLPCAAPTIVGFYNPSCDASGNLLPPAHFNYSIQAAVDASVRYYDRSPLDSHGLPSYTYATFLDGNYTPTSFDIIAGMQDGMGILGYIAYAERAKAGRGGIAEPALAAATHLATYLTLWANSASDGVWANVTRSSGYNFEWPLTTAGQDDVLFGINTIEPDKVALAGYALLRLATAVTNPDPSWMAQALRNARALAATRTSGNSTHSPWPFRVDSVTGAAVDGAKCGNAVFALRLFLGLSAAYPEFAPHADGVWTWILDYQLRTADPALDGSISLFVNFYEDKTGDTNRNSWTSTELARFLIESRASNIDPDWRAHVEALFNYSLTLFAVEPGVGNVTLMGEQDNDRKPWGGTSSKVAGVASLFGCAVGSDQYRQLGANNAAWMSYFTAVDGCRSAEAYAVNATPTRGGWTEDAWTDVLLNLVDAMDASDGVC